MPDVDTRRAEEELKRRLGDAYRFLKPDEKRELIQAILRRPRR